MRSTMKNYKNHLAGCASFAAVMMAGHAYAQAAKPDSEAPQAEQAAVEKDVIVTGTRIRGVAAVGSATIPVDRNTIAERATGSTNDILRDVPQVTNFGAGNNQIGGPQVQNSSLNNTYVNSVNLRGLGTTATLTMVDGHRVAPSGGGGGYTDSDIIPAIALQRVEVVADGSSAIYGSDAVAGVVNLRIREPFTGAETAVGTTVSDGTHTFKASGVFGLRNERGGIMVAGEHFTQKALAASDRPNLYNDDLTPYGGAAVSNIAFPGNVSINNVVYAIPAGQNGQGFTLGKLGTAGSPNRQSIFAGIDILPKQRRDTGLVKYDYQLTDNLKFFGFGVYSERKAEADQAAPSSPGYTVPVTNPFSPCAPGVSRTNSVGAACPANGSLTVIHSWLGELGNSRRYASETAMDFTNGFELRLPSDWKATLAGTYGRTRNYANANSVNNNAVNVLLAAPGASVNVAVPGTGTVAVVHPTNIPSLNLFCGTTPCNDPASLAYITSYSGNVAKSVRKDVTLGFDGPLFQLPAGMVRLAAGGEYLHDYMFNNSFTTNTTATVASDPITLPTSKSRNMKSAYAEMYVPLFGPDNAMPLIQRLDLSLAVRYDRYSDFGSTTNPKVGFTWMPFSTLSVHGTYGTSFRAPTIAETNPLAGANVIVERGVAASALTGINQTTGNYVALTTIGGNANLRAEEATTFSLGFDYKPIPGMVVTLNYYDIDYKNRIETPANSAGFPANVNASPLYDGFVTYNPAFFPTRSTVTQAQFDALLAAKLASKTPPVSQVLTVTNNIIALINGTRANSGSLSTNGLDMSARYSWAAGAGQWTIGMNGTYVLNYKYAPVKGAQVRDYVNMFSTIGSPLRFRGRGQVGWAGNGFSANVYANYQNAYNYPNGTNFYNINLLPAGVTAGTHGKIKANTTFDLAMSYDTKDNGPSLLKNVVLRAYVSNAFDRKPPFVLNGTVQFDPTQASQVGRTLSLQLTKRW